MDLATAHAITPSLSSHDEPGSPPSQDVTTTEGAAHHKFAPPDDDPAQVYSLNSHILFTVSQRIWRKLFWVDKVLLRQFQCFRPLLALYWASGQTVNFERVNELLVIRKKPFNQKEENEEVDLAINTAVPNVPTIPPPTIQGVLSLKTKIYP